MKSGLYNSYLVRFWQVDEREKTETRWHGEVESIQTGQTWQFTRLESMLHFLEEGLGKSSANQVNNKRRNEEGTNNEQSHDQDVASL